MKAIFILHHIGDIIGYKNGKWISQVNNNMKTPDIYIMLNMIYNFINIGGINYIDLTKEKSYLPTSLHIAMLTALIKFSGSYNDRENKIFLFQVSRGIEHTIQKLHKNKFNYIDRYLLKLKNTINGNHIDSRDNIENLYDIKGPECAMMNLCVGIYFNNESDIIDYCMNMNMLLTSSPYGYLSGLTSAIFTFYGFNNFKIEDWPITLIKILKKNKLKNHIKLDNTTIYSEYINYINYWEKYLEYRSNNKIDLFYRLEELYTLLNEKDIFGYKGYFAIILAYDSLFLSRDNIEKLIYYSTMYNGYSHASGSIALGLYGSLYGFKNVPKNLLKISNFYDNIFKVGLKMLKQKTGITMDRDDTFDLFLIPDSSLI